MDDRATARLFLFSRGINSAHPGCHERHHKPDIRRTRISSFGEDEQGELYVVDLAGGSISRIASTTPCKYSITPTNESFGSAAGTGTVAVAAGSGCSWNATSNASFVQVTSGATGTGNGGVGCSVDANLSASPRAGTMTIAGLTFTVNRSGAATCTYTIGTTRATFEVDGGTGTVIVSAPTGCGWTAVSNAPWITITGGASGSGDGAVTYSVAPYTGKHAIETARYDCRADVSIKQSR